MFKINQKVFKKLYPYYCKKLLEVLPLTIIYLLVLGIFIGAQIFSSFSILKEAGERDWQTIFFRFWAISSSIQIGIGIMTSQLLVKKLVGREMIVWRPSRRSGLFGAASKENDICTLTYLPSASREDLIYAKLASVFTYFWLINFIFLTLPFTLYFLFSGSVGIGATLIFFFLSAIVFSITNFLMIIPLLFYIYESGNLWVLLGLFFVIIALTVLGTFLKYSSFPLFFLPILASLVSVAIGWFFFRSYQNEFCSKDLC